MFDLILSVVKNDKRIRSVILNRSRTNKSIPKDNLQDYDIVYLVTEISNNNCR